MVWWRLRDGDHTLRYRYPLIPESVVVDAGGYTGEWAQGIVDRYGCKVLLFEPQETYALMCRTRFAGDKRVIVHHAALLDKDGATTIATGIDGVTGRGGERTLCVDAAVALPKHVDLLKLNVEGDEYRIIKHLAAKDRLKDIRHLQIQFHKGSREYAEVESLLLRHHRRLWRYPGVWETWRRV